MFISELCALLANEHFFWDTLYIKGNPLTLNRQGRTLWSSSFLLVGLRCRFQVLNLISGRRVATNIFRMVEVFLCRLGSLLNFYSQQTTIIAMSPQLDCSCTYCTSCTTHVHTFIKFLLSYSYILFSAHPDSM